MPVTIIRQNPDDWPKTFGKLVLRGIDYGQPPRIEFQFDAATSVLKIKPTKSTEPTHKILISDKGGKLGEGTISHDPGGSFLGIRNSSGYQSVWPIPNQKLPLGKCVVHLDWGPLDAQVTETREEDHKKDVELAYNLTWAEVDRMIQTIAGRDYRLAPGSQPSGKPTTPVLTLQQFTAEFLATFDSESLTNFGGEAAHGNEFYTKNRAGMYTPQQLQEFEARGRTIIEKDAVDDYTKQSRVPAAPPGLDALKHQVIADLRALLPAELKFTRDAGATPDSVCKSATDFWDSRFDQTASKTARRDFCWQGEQEPEHSGTFEFASIDTAVNPPKVVLKRVPSTTDRKTPASIITLGPP